MSSKTNHRVRLLAEGRSLIDTYREASETAELFRNSELGKELTRAAKNGWLYVPRESYCVAETYISACNGLRLGPRESSDVASSSMLAIEMCVALEKTVEDDDLQDYIRTSFTIYVPLRFCLYKIVGTRMESIFNKSAFKRWLQAQRQVVYDRAFKDLDDQQVRLNRRRGDLKADFKRTTTNSAL